ncbi:MAG: tetratricopeptide repeat protein [Deltaproteobacteria bacterium]|nr:tetratricopeptide repeat protein [Deltaproteobacteria bacterium]
MSTHSCETTSWSGSSRSAEKAVPGYLLPRVAERITAASGIGLPPEKYGDLKRALELTARERGFADASALAGAILSPRADEEALKSLIQHFTIRETSFFRAGSIFQALEEHILPELEGKKARDGGQLRFWSAACCSGEEVYSLAMVLDRKLYFADKTRPAPLILGSDINTRFLAQAREGVYTRWSFRGVPSWVMEKYFRQTGDNEFRIREDLKKRVRLFALNLASDAYPSASNATHDLDVIFLCNVLMYMSNGAREQITERMARCLAPGGWLIVSHSEVGFIDHPQFNPVSLPGITVYRKEAPAQKARTRPRRRPAAEAGRRGESKSPSPAESAAGGPERSGSLPQKDEGDPYQEMLRLFQAKRYDELMQGIHEIMDNGGAAASGGRGARYMTLAARACANQGKLDEARKWCERAVGEEKLNPGHLYLLATILSEQGREKEAHRHLDSALYLDSGFVMAHFAMANLARNQGRTAEAADRLQTILSLLAGKDPHEVLPHSEGMTVASLREVAQFMLREES